MRQCEARKAHDRWRAGEVSIVDIREEEEHEETRVPEVPLIPMSQFLERIGELPEGPLVILCRSGSRSNAVAQYLANEGGRPEVENLSGGIIAWAAEGLPYEGSPPR